MEPWIEEAKKKAALDKVIWVEREFRMFQSLRHSLWVDAASCGATHVEIAIAAKVDRATIMDQLWIRA